MNKLSRGFTLLELILVILVIGFLSVAVAPKWTAVGIGVNDEARRVLNDIRYAQALSLISGQRYRWLKISSTVYQITNETGTAIMLPSGSNQLTLSGGVTMTSLTNLPNNLIVFNSRGVPYIDAATPGTLLSSAATISLSTGGITRTVQISPQTGYGALL